MNTILLTPRRESSPATPFDAGWTVPAGTCRVTHGANDSVFEIVGKSVVSVRRALSTAFNIPVDAAVFINGTQVDHDYWLRPGDHVEWVRQFGWKGGSEADLARLARLEERIAKIEACLAPEWVAIAKSVGRIADHFDPPPPDKVDTAYVAGRLGCGLPRVAQMALRGEIPSGCIVPGTGEGKPWKFYRSRIEQWIESR